jgi:site-specific DNA-methyltransferase (adenine-specific)
VYFELNKIYNESNLETMSRMPDNFIDLTVTSPPYDNLRNYKGFEFPFEEIAKELYRVTKIGGVVVWIVGDATNEGSETGTSFKQALYFKDIGFNIHDTMIYNRFGRYPEALRYRNDFEYMFILTRGYPKTYNKIKDRKNIKPVGSSLNGTERKNNEELESKTTKRVRKQFGDRGNIWNYQNGLGNTTVDEIAYEHPAIFPEKLAADHIYSWSNEGDIVYDCFGGSGTTAKMAHLMKRNWILSEISAEYCQLAQKRISPYLAQTSMF